LESNVKEVTVVVRKGDIIKVSGDGLKFAARALTEKNPERAIRRGAVIRLQAGEKGAWSIAQVPRVEASLVSVDPRNGAILALAGGFDFNANKFNHATQAWRQPGSSFKPFIYSAALEKGFTPATVLNDAPFVIEAAKTGGQLWEPKNYDGKYEGPMRLQMASAYAVFANGGYRVKPWFIARIEDNRGEVLYQAKPEVAGADAERVL